MQVRYSHLHMERLSIMRILNNISFLPRLMWAVLLILMALPFTHGESNSGDFDVWHRYSTEQQKMSIAGFVHGYRSVSLHKDAFSESEDIATIKMIDQAAMIGKDAQIGRLILQALKKAPDTKPDVHAEQWSGPYGFATGLWWRQIPDQDRQAYVQGVFWSTEVVDGVKVFAPDMSVQLAVKQLNDWYVISDEDWKDPRSNARVDVPVVLAMQTSGIISIGQPTKTQ